MPRALISARSLLQVLAIVAGGSFSVIANDGSPENTVIEQSAVRRTLSDELGEVSVERESHAIDSVTSTVVAARFFEEENAPGDSWMASESVPSGSSTSDRGWFDADYVLLWTNGNPIPPLVTTNSVVPRRAEAGVLGTGDTRILLGDDDVDVGVRSGVALTSGIWLDGDQTWGLQGTWLYVGAPSDELDAGWQSDGTSVLARPFYSVGWNREDSQLVAYPNIVEGQTTAAAHSYLRSVEGLLRANWRRGTRGRIDVLGGYRHLQFREELMLQEHLVSRNPGGVVQVGTTIDLFDNFDARNSFHGGGIGLLTSLERGCLLFDITTKLAAGNIERRLVINGLTDIETPAGGHATRTGGLFALTSNMGTYESNTLALLPELDFQTRCRLSECVTLNIGYNLLFLTSVYRTGNQLDRSVDASQLSPVLPVNNPTAAGQLRPAPLWDSSTLRAQSLSVGISVVY